MTRSLRFQSLAFVIGMLVATTAAIALATLREMNRTVNDLELQSARNAVNLVLLTLENNYRSLSFHRTFALEERKRQMSDSVGLVMAAIAEHHDLARRGLLSDRNARQAILDAVQGLRYGANDYFFIYDDSITAIAHPDPVFRGRHLADIPDAKGNYPGRDLMGLARQGGGFVPFWWKRLESTTPVPKLGYARYFSPWGWMVGTGVYIDDIEAEYRRRLEGVIADLSTTLARVKIAGGGYLFIIDGNRRVVIHPEGERDRFTTARNPGSGNLLADDLMAAARSDIPLDYLWDRPEATGQFRFEKTALVARFAPLDWYVVASIYRDDLRRPARNLVVTQLLIISLVSGMGIMGSIIIVNRFVRPVERLATYARELPARDFSRATEECPDVTHLADRPDELGRLAASLLFMEHALHEYLERLTEATAARERVAGELAVARDIQMGLLHCTFPPFPDRNDFELYAIIQPAREVGGDCYDFFLADDRHLFFMVGDVAGKGAPAALYMAVTVSLIRAIARDEPSPARILGRLNRELSRDTTNTMFVTTYCGILDTRTGTVTFANGGHNPPLVVRRNGTVELTATRHVLPPGAMEETLYGDETLILAPGDTMFLYTDGVTEAMNREGELYSIQGMRKVLANGGEDGIQDNIDRLMAAVAQHADGAPQTDDITIMGIRYLGDGSHAIRPSPESEP